MVPAAAMGLDLQAFLDATALMVRSCASGTPPSQNPGLQLGLAMGEAASAGHDKLTIFASTGLSDVGAWLEQLVAESTGKIGKGIVPVDGEPIGKPDAYGNDRLFAYLQLEGETELDSADRRPRSRRPPRRPLVIKHPIQVGQTLLRLGVRHRRRRLDHRHQPLRPARRRSQQDRDPQAHRRLRRRPASSPPRNPSPPATA